jgi:thiamine biosynthesis protein ThiI
MTFDHIIIRYGELSLKGKNRKEFIDRLQQNIKEKLKNYPEIVVKKKFDKMFVRLHGYHYEPVVQKLQQVFGIQGLSIALKTNSEPESIKQGALAAIKEIDDVKTFKISAKRIDKDYPIHSKQLNPLLGGHILENIEGISVDVHNPDVDLRVEVNKNMTYISGIEFPGAGGLPVGVGGKVFLMLSGGIDSPVAAYLTLKRGVKVEAVHFHSPPFTSERAKQKVKDICRQITHFGGSIRLHAVHFTEVQTAINDHIHDNYRMTIMRRMMLRIAEKIAEQNEGLALATGESLGQVASQTLGSMNTINEVTTMPIIRPVITMDKLEIMSIAKKIGTYNISIRPYEDCCTVFLSTAPKTKPDRQHANKFEQSLPVEELVEKSVANTEVVKINDEQTVDQQFYDLF